MTSADLDSLIQRQDGVLSRRQALRHVTEAKLRQHLASRRWQVAHRGIYVTHNGPLTQSQRTWVGLLAVGSGRPRVVLAGLSALACAGLRGCPPDNLEIYLPNHLRVTSVPGYVRVRRVSGLKPEDVASNSWPPRTTIARAVIDAARWAPSDEGGRVVITAAFEQSLVTKDDLLAAAYRMTRLRRRLLIFATIHNAARASQAICEDRLVAHQ